MASPNTPFSDGAGSLAKVLIVDDSVVARGLLTRWIGEHPDMVVVAAAADGVNAVRAAARHQPDIVILDLDMPVMDGVTALPEILKVSPASSVMIASSLTARSARLSMQCLALGAVEIQPKPESNRDFSMSLAFRDELMRKAEGLIHARPRAPRQRLHLPASPGIGHSGPSSELGLEARRAAPSGPDTLSMADIDIMPRVLLIGASTGGPRAVSQVLEMMGQALLQLPVIIVQHMPPVFTASFAEQLAQRTRRPTREARDGDQPLAGHIYVAPGGRHLRLAKTDGQVRMVLDDSPPHRFCRPAVDHLFSDAASVFGASALAVVLTGMGNDGTEGSRHLRRVGAHVIAQDEASSVVWGMPGAVVREKLASAVLPLAQIGPMVARLLESRARA